MLMYTQCLSFVLKWYFYGRNIFAHLFYIQARLCTGFQELNSIINCQLSKIRIQSECHATHFGKVHRISMCLRWLISNDRLQRLTFSPLSLDTCLLSVMSHLLPRIIFSTSDEACWEKFKDSLCLSTQ